MTTRANKTRSEKRVIAASYSNSVDASTLLSIVTGIEAPVIDIMYTLCLHKLDAFHLMDASHVQQVIGDYRHCNQLDFQVPEHIWQSDDDLLGFILQSFSGAITSPEEALALLQAGASLVEVAQGIPNRPRLTPKILLKALDQPVKTP